MQKNADICINYAINNVRVDSNLDFESIKSITNQPKIMTNIQSTLQAEKKECHCSDGHFNVIVFILGFVTWLNGPLIPFFELACELTSSQAYFVTFAFYIAYFVMAIPSSYIIEKWDIKTEYHLDY